MSPPTIRRVVRRLERDGPPAHVQIEDRVAEAIARGDLQPGSRLPAKLLPGFLRGPLDGSLYEVLRDRYRLAPARALERLEPVVATAREGEALGVREGAPLLLVERTAFAASGVPLEYARDLF